MKPLRWLKMLRLIRKALKRLEANPMNWLWILFEWIDRAGELLGIPPGYKTEVVLLAGVFVEGFNRASALIGGPELILTDPVLAIVRGVATLLAVAFLLVKWARRRGKLDKPRAVRLARGR